MASRQSELALNLEQSARLSVRLADQAARARKRKSPPEAAALACTLYRQAIYYSLRALQELNAPPSAEASPALPSRQPADLAALFREAPRALMSSLAGADRMGFLEQRLCASTFVDFGLSEPSEIADFTQELGKFARALLRAVEQKQRVLERKAAARSLLVVALGALVALCVCLSLILPELLEARRDLARNKPWQASSLYVGSCESPQQECPGTKAFFVHTNQESEPWLMLDLTAVQRISSAYVVNRDDCCTDRSAPLVLEVSTDQKQWKEVARMPGAFRDWRPNFAPVPARWVRLRVARHSILHLKRVRIFP